MYKIEFYVPETHLEKVKAAVFAAGAGRIGDYDCCSWQTAGSGQFRPCGGSKPFIGEKDRVETVLEYKVELVCASKYISKVIDSLIKSHPYETPAYQYWEVELGGLPSHPTGQEGPQL
ncbi:MAG: NGG1p interacting factor NIF3 [Lentisphaerota bacterium]